ncbi:CHAT domain protein [Anatilimnocola aggregata]|uniref:CHAT domain protein n=1 Tax=Anatilimnocola aggregata TaxID=2528021 RepID=A0A517Y4E1_9BACT|nr:CHAT domain-containing protein [Anatilimnocola aggregata]QDU25104.1 CHAT domain protein [Anatilimnocola aggregata]
MSYCRPFLLMLSLVVLADLLHASPAVAQTSDAIIDQFWEQYRAGQFDKAEQAALQLRRLHEQNNRPAGVGVARFLLGRAAESQERYDDAEQHYRAALKILPDADSAPLTTEVQHVLALLLKNQNQFAEAEQFYRSVVTRLTAKEGANSPKLIAPLTELADSHMQQLQFAESEPLLIRARNIAEKQTPPLDYQLAAIVRTFGLLRGRQHRLSEAESLLRDALHRFEQLQNANGIAVLNEDLALLLIRQARYRSAEDYAQRALQLRLQQFGAENSSVANVQNTLGRVYAKQGRLREAEALLQRALGTRLRTLGPGHAKVATSLVDLADVYAAQARFANAAQLLHRALAIDEKVWGSDHRNLLTTLASLGYVVLQLGQHDEAVKLAQQSLQILGSDSSAAGPGHAALAQISLNRKDYAAAEREYLRAIELNEKFIAETGNPFHRISAPALRGLARVYQATARHELADAKFNEAIAALELDGGSSGELCAAYWERGRSNWALGKHPSAAADFTKAMQLAEQQRSQFSGSDSDRSQSFANSTVVFEDMVRLQAEIGDVNAALNAIERGRNQSLLDQLAMQGIDLLDTLPAPQRADFEQRLATVQTRVATAEQQLQDVLSVSTLAIDERRRRSIPLHRELTSARSEYVSLGAAIRNASPAYRLAVSERHEPVVLSKLQEYVASQKGLLLRYIVGDGTSFVLIVPAQGTPRLIELTVDSHQARTLEIEAGKLDERKLAIALQNDQKTGILQLLRQSEYVANERPTTDKLFALWQILIPPTERALLMQGDVQRLLIVPDGDLTMLPWEALVVEAGQVPQYLLDVGPPILYCPSATILCNLARRAATPHSAGQLNVLTVGDPVYGAVAEDRGRGGSTSKQRGVVGQLSRLPYSGLESGWVEQIMTKAGMKVSKLTGSAASEAEIRQRLSGQHFIHFACHGLVDPSYGNLFGALAVTAGNSRAVNESEDGFLTLAEIYKLDLRSAELTILSACDTNAGPTQSGEGVWSLSRGFLVAGSRRVVASNWVVDDQAGATLISYYSRNLTKEGKLSATPDYAQALHSAKRSIRKEEKWRNPFYWSSLVLVGPN